MRSSAINEFRLQGLGRQCGRISTGIQDAKFLKQNTHGHPCFSQKFKIHSTKKFTTRHPKFYDCRFWVSSFIVAPQLSQGFNAESSIQHLPPWDMRRQPVTYPALLLDKTRSRPMRKDTSTSLHPTSLFT